MIKLFLVTLFCEINLIGILAFSVVVFRFLYSIGLQYKNLTVPTSFHIFNPKWYGGGGGGEEDGIHPKEVFLHCATTFGTTELKLFDF